MCLTTNSIPRIARRDIKVYKVLDVAGLKQFCTPYRAHVVHEKTMTAKGAISRQLPLLTAIYRTFKKRKSYIDEGIHSFASIKDVKKNWSDFYEKAVLIEAVIPKGTRYVKGIFGDDTDSYASDKLVLREIDETLMGSRVAFSLNEVKAAFAEMPVL